MEADSGKKELTLDATVENIEEVTKFVNEKLEKAGCPAKTRMQIDIAIDELFGNIAQYAYGTGTGQAAVLVEFTGGSAGSSTGGSIGDLAGDSTGGPAQVLITFMDKGVPYNPLDSEDPDISLPAGERRIGGLGIYLVKKSMDDISYEYRDGRNILRIRKRL